MPGPVKSSTTAMLARQFSRINMQVVSEINQAKRDSVSESREDQYDSLFTSALNVALYGHNQFTLLRGNIDDTIKRDLMPTSKSSLEPDVTFYPTLLNYPTPTIPANAGIQAPPANSNLVIFICPMSDKNGAIIIDSNIENNMRAVLAKKSEDRPPCFFILPSDLPAEQIKKIEAAFPNFPVIKTDLLKEEYDPIIGDGHTNAARQSKVAQLFIDINDKLPKPIAEDTTELSRSASITPSGPK